MVDNPKGKLDHIVDDNFSLDDIEDLPSFKVPPTGAYTVELTKGFFDVDINDEPYWQIDMTILSVEDVNEKELGEGETMPEVGEVCSTVFHRRNAFGVGNFKKFVLSIAQKYNITFSEKGAIGKLREVMPGVQMLVILKRVYNKDKDRYNLNVKTAHVI
jgi:hypothetical protein